MKTHARAPAGMYAREAEGLRWLAEARRAAHSACSRRQRRRGRRAGVPGARVDRARRARARDYDERLGRGLAALHASARAGFGFARDNFIAVLPQHNAPAPRLAGVLRRTAARAAARAGGRARPRRARRMRSGIERVCARLPELCGPAEPPARLHGDLWGGNAIADEHGAPVLIDPAVYGGHREIDLAMMRAVRRLRRALLRRLSTRRIRSRRATKNASRCTSCTRCSCTSTCSAAATRLRSNARFHGFAAHGVTWLSLVVKFVPFDDELRRRLPVSMLPTTWPVSTLARISMPKPLPVPAAVSLKCCRERRAART